MINLFSYSDYLDINKKEVLRYLGYGEKASMGLDNNYIDLCIEETKKIIEPKACFEKFKILLINNDVIDLGFTTIKSKSLSKNLRDCSEVYFFTATIGVNVDREIQKFSKISPSKAVITQAVGAAAVECLCDILCERLKNAESEFNRYLRPRFSPGYGDFDIDFQKTIFRVLDCSRKIGVTITDNCLMVPSKSVSALIGVSEIDSKCISSGCEACTKTDCSYRRR